MPRYRYFIYLTNGADPVGMLTYKTTEGDIDKAADIILALVTEPLYGKAPREPWSALVVRNGDLRVTRPAPRT